MTTLGRWDTLRFDLTHTAPQLLRGVFTRRPGLSSMLARRLADPQGVQLVQELRERYGDDYLRFTMAGKPSILVLHPDGVRHVLGASPDVYGPPDLKVRGMAHFQPGAVTISSGEAWTRRRAFNDDVLATGRSVHPLAGHFSAVVGREIDRIVPRGAGQLAWPDLHAAFRRITAGVVFGTDVDAEPLLKSLDALLVRANRIVGRPDSDALRTFQEDLRALSCDATARGLVRLACPHVHEGDPLPVAGQTPHWLFALKDTVGTNCAYALALIAAHPEVQERARADAGAHDPADPESVDRMGYVDGCLRDAMRLWPTTPLIIRKALRDDDLVGHHVTTGTQAIIHNGFHHRNPDSFSDPDRFRPEEWKRGVWDDRFNAMSNGPQACAGRDLVMFLGKAVLGRLLRSHRWRLTSPSLDPGRAIPYAFDHTAMVLAGSP